MECDICRPLSHQDGFRFISGEEGEPIVCKNCGVSTCSQCLSHFVEEKFPYVPCFGEYCSRNVPALNILKCIGSEKLNNLLRTNVSEKMFFSRAGTHNKLKVLVPVYESHKIVKKQFREIIVNNTLRSKYYEYIASMDSSGEKISFSEHYISKAMDYIKNCRTNGAGEVRFISDPSRLFEIQKCDKESCCGYRISQDCPERTMRCQFGCDEPEESQEEAEGDSCHCPDCACVVKCEIDTEQAFCKGCKCLFYHHTKLRVPGGAVINNSEAKNYIISTLSIEDRIILGGTRALFEANKYLISQSGAFESRFFSDFFNLLGHCFSKSIDELNTRMGKTAEFDKSDPNILTLKFLSGTRDVSKYKSKMCCGKVKRNLQSFFRSFSLDIFSELKALLFYISNAGMDEDILSETWNFCKNVNEIYLTKYEELFGIIIYGSKWDFEYTIPLYSEECEDLKTFCERFARISENGFYNSKNLTENELSKIFLNGVREKTKKLDSEFLDELEIWENMGEVANPYYDEFY